jgi:hypothetical protein
MIMRIRSWREMRITSAQSWKALMRLANLNNPHLKHRVIEYLKKANDELLGGKIRYASRASCRPPGAPEFLVHGAGIQAIHFLQTAKEALMINDGDTQLFDTLRNRFICVSESAGQKLFPRHSRPYDCWA